MRQPDNGFLTRQVPRNIRTMRGFLIWNIFPVVEDDALFNEEGKVGTPRQSSPLVLLHTIFQIQRRIFSPRLCKEFYSGGSICIFDASFALASSMVSARSWICSGVACR